MFNNGRKGGYCVLAEFSYTVISRNVKEGNTTKEPYDLDKICTQSNEAATQFLCVAKSKVQEKSKGYNVKQKELMTCL